MKVRNKKKKDFGVSTRYDTVESKREYITYIYIIYIKVMDHIRNNHVNPLRSIFVILRKYLRKYYVRWHTISSHMYKKKKNGCSFSKSSIP